MNSSYNELDDKQAVVPDEEKMAEGIEKEKKIEKCPMCQASLKSFWHTLTPGLVSGLVEAIKFVHSHGRNEFHLQQDLPLTKTQYNNFQKLRFHGLVTHVEGKPGYWLITRRGGQFLRREIVVPLRVRTFRNQVVEHSEAAIHIDSLKNKIPYYETTFAWELISPERLESLTANQIL